MKRTKKRAARVARFFLQPVNQKLCWVCSAVIVSKALSHKVEFLIPRLNERSLPEPFTFFCYSDGNFKIMQTTLLWYIIIN